MQTVAEHLFAHPYEFDFFQAVWLLEQSDVRRKSIGGDGPAALETVRFRAWQSLNFPASTVHSLDRLPPPSAKAPAPPPEMVVTFLGMTGPNGALPIHYSQLLIEKLAKGRGAEKTALRDWLDLFNHRLTALFYRAWEKYRIAIPYVRYAREKRLAEGGGSVSLDVSRVQEAQRAEPNLFTLCLCNLIGLGVAPLRNQLKVTVRIDEGPVEAYHDPALDRLRLAHVEDLALLHFGGFLCHRPRNVVNLEALLAGYFRLAVGVEQFTGQWLHIQPVRQSRLEDGANNELAVNVVCGEQVWDAVSKFRVRVGPLGYKTFVEFLPDRRENTRKAFFLLSQLVRLYVGMEFDFEVQLVLKGDEVPACELREDNREENGAWLGWNTWLPAEEVSAEIGDAYFEGDECIELPRRAAR